VGAVVDEGFWAGDAAGDVVALEDVDYVERLAYSPATVLVAEVAKVGNMTGLLPWTSQRSVGLGVVRIFDVVHILLQMRKERC
jgi:hypothetical protein